MTREDSRRARASWCVLSRPSSPRRAVNARDELAGRRNPAASGLDDAGPRDEVVPASPALVHEDPDEADVEDEVVDPVADEAQERRTERDRTAVHVAHDLDVRHPHPGRLPAVRPEVREVEKG